MAKEFAKVLMVRGRGSTLIKIFASVLHTLTTPPIFNQPPLLSLSLLAFLLSNPPSFLRFLEIFSFYISICLRISVLMNL